ncbi:hypothetical protein [Mycobacterium heckeshornense]|uniref:hypothetical protein n=1 Tax=Mycobacterium heckeshornense TaxID=110505 RepID=UPI000B2CC838|nr:hypothetical protein [Mycobacterium heckeshornense]
MTLSHTAVGKADQTAPPLVLQISASRLEPRCHVCRTDEVRQRVNDLLASGASYASTLRALGGDAVGVSTDSIRPHAELHFPVQNAAQATYREILERRVKENGVDFVNGVATALAPIAFYEVVMNKAFGRLVEGEVDFSVDTGLRAAEKLQAQIDARTGQVDTAVLRAEMGRIIDTVRAFVPQERGPNYRRHCGEKLLNERRLSRWRASA